MWWTAERHLTERQSLDRVRAYPWISGGEDRRKAMGFLVSRAKIRTACEATRSLSSSQRSRSQGMRAMALS